jgi:hypothetical protein
VSNYFKVGEDGRSEELPLRVRPADDYRAIYAHGAQGGFLHNYHLRLDFYQDIVPFLDFKEMGGIIPKESVSEIERKIMASIYLPLPFAKELVRWMQKKIDTHEREYGEIQLAKTQDERAATKSESSEAR